MSLYLYLTESVVGPLKIKSGQCIGQQDSSSFSSSTCSTLLLPRCSPEARRLWRPSYQLRPRALCPSIVPGSAFWEGRSAPDPPSPAHDTPPPPTPVPSPTPGYSQGVGKTALAAALLGRTAEEVTPTPGIQVSHCWATPQGEWREGEQAPAPAPAPSSATTTRSVSLSGLKADYEHSLAHSVAQEVARLQGSSSSRYLLLLLLLILSFRLEGERGALAARSLTSFIRSNLKNSSRSKERARAASRSKNKVVPGPPREEEGRVPEPIAAMVEDFLSRDRTGGEEAILPNCQVLHHPALFLGSSCHHLAACTSY